MVRNNKVNKFDSKQSGPRTNRAACTINEYTNGHEGVLSMTSLMDATEGGEQNNLKQNNTVNHHMGLKPWTSLRENSVENAWLVKEL
jgi:hypothetical protein